VRSRPGRRHILNESRNSPQACYFPKSAILYGIQHGWVDDGIPRKHRSDGGPVVARTALWFVSVYAHSSCQHQLAKGRVLCRLICICPSTVLGVGASTAQVAPVGVDPGSAQYGLPHDRQFP
jgi:hypothetical protein